MIDESNNDSEMSEQPDREPIEPTDESEFDPLEPQISDEELNRRFENPGRLYTTEEVLAHLASLPPPKE